MLLNISDKPIHGFVVKNRTEINELDAVLIEMEHKATGASLAWLARAEENKSFCIAFPTIPDNDTGVFHIIEHSVLGGSERYPVKEPFLDLMKGSMQTFLNAITYPDKTVFPVSSRNDKDFMNLIQVYLDGVFHPLIYSRPEIFMQEGWHLEGLTDDTLPENVENLFYKGIVLNEMKGEFASPDVLIDNELARQLFPDCCYRYVSGGDPLCIPDLTYEQFLDYHRKFYNPSSAFIALDGKIDIDSVLGLLDDELNRADRNHHGSDFRNLKPVQPEINEKHSTIRYEPAYENDSTRNSYLAYGILPGLSGRMEERLAIRVISDVLCQSPKSPLTERILSEDLADSISVNLVDGISLPYVTIKLKNIDSSKAGYIRSVIDDEIRHQIDNGLDKELIRASLASLEFSVKERSYGDMPQGVGLCLSMVNGMYYDHRAGANLEYTDIFRYLNEHISDGWFEKLMEKIFINCRHRCEVTMLASSTVSSEFRAAEQKHIMKLLSETSAGHNRFGSLKGLKSANDGLISWQNSEDLPENTAKLPHLTLDDISETPEYVHTNVGQYHGIPLIRHDIVSKDIVYCNLYFDISDVSPEMLPLYSLLSALPGSLGTKTFSAIELQKNMGLDLGSFSCAVEPYGRKDEPDKCRIYMCVSFCALESGLKQAEELVFDIISNTVYDNADDLYEIIRYIYDDMEAMLTESGNDIAAMRVYSKVSAAGFVYDLCTGYTFFEYIRKLLDEFDQSCTELINSLNKISRSCFCKNRLTLCVSGGSDHVTDHFADMLNLNPDKNGTTDVFSFCRKDTDTTEFIPVPGNIAYTAAGGNLHALGRDYAGYEPVICKIISLVYLWNAIRVRGGAYDTGCSVSDSGNIIFYSYRDPDYENTLDIYKDAADFLREYISDETDFTDFIISTIADDEPFMMPGSLAKQADGRYFHGITYETLCAQRRQMLSITSEDVYNFSQDLDRLLSDLHQCVVTPGQ